MKPNSLHRRLALFAPLALTLTLSAHAATVTKASSGTDLADGASWGGTAPTATDTAAWTGTSLGAGLTLDAAAAWQGIAATGALSNIGITGSGTLTLGTSGIDLAASVVDISAANSIALNGNQTWKAAAGRSIGVSGAISGTGNLTCGGAPPTSTYNAGYLSANSGSPTTVFPGATLANFSGASGVIAGGWITTPTPAAGYFFTHTSPTTAAVQLQFYDGTTFTKVAKVQLTQVGADVVAHQLYAKYKTGNNVGQNFDDPYPITGTPPVGSGGYGVNSLTVSIGAAASGTVSLSGTNSYAGTTNVAVGTLAVAGGNAIPDASAVSLSTGSTLLLNANETIGSLAGSGSANLQGNTLTAGGNNTSTTLSGTLSGAGGALVKTGTGTMTLTNTGTYTGGTTVSQGIIVTSTNSGLGASGTVVMNDANTGTNSTSLFAQVPVTGDLIFPNPITVANQGSGTVAIGTNRTGAGRTFFNGEIALNRDLTISSMLTDRTMFRGGIRGTGNLTITGGNRTTLSDVIAENEGEGTALYDFTGNVTLTGTGTVVQINSNMEFTNAGTVTVDTGATLRTAYGKTLGVNALAGAGTMTSVAGSGTLIVGIKDGGATFSGLISGTGGDALKLTKIGTGTQILTGANTYTGATTINGGTLKLGTGGSINGSASITVTSGAVFDATDTGFTLGTGKILTAGDLAAGNDVTGSVISQGTIRPGGNGAVGTLTGITNLTLGGTLAWDRDANSTAGDAIAINGTLTISAGFSLTPTVLGFPFSGGTRTYTVVSGLTAALTPTDIGNLPVLPTNYAWNTTDPTALKIDHVQPGANLTWSGTVLGGNWDTASANWNGGLGVFQPGDYCTFDDTATGTTTVEIPADVAPTAILVNNSTAVTYTLGSASSLGITGETSLIKTGGGLLVLTSNNIHTGGTMLTEGTIAFGPSGLSTAGPITLNGGTLRWHDTNTQDISAAIDMVNGKTATFDTNGNNVVFTSGLGDATTASLVKTGAGNLNLGGTGTWTGTTEVLAGTLTAGSNTAFGAPTVLIGTGSADTAIMVANRADIANSITVSATGTGAVTIGADNSGTGLNASTIAGLITLNRATSISSAVPTDRLAIEGRITGNVGTLTVTGGSRTTFYSTLNDFTGDVVVTGAGSVLQTSVASPAEVIPDASNVTVEAGAFLQLASNSGAESINGLSGSGTVRTYVDLTNPAAIYGSVLSVGGANGSATFAGTIVNGNGALSLTKAGTGTQSLGGFNTYTGNTVVNAGTLHLLDDAALTFRVTNTAHNTLTGAGTVILDGNFAIDVSAVTNTTGTWQLESADSLAGAYGSSFQVVTPAGAPWTDAGGDKWTYSAGNLEFTFDETTGTLTVEQGGFASWIAGFGLDAADQDPGDDPDHDGLTNLVEYALDGRSPAVSDGAPGTFASNTLSFAKRALAAADPKISYMIVESDDLGLTDAWTEAPAGPDYTNNTTTISYTLPTGKAKTFARLVVTQAP